MSVTTDATMLSTPRAPAVQAESYLVSRPHGSYSDQEVSEIVNLYYEAAGPAGLDSLVVIGQMALETGRLTSFWSQPPRRNPAGIGVTGAPGEGLSFVSWPVAVRAHVGRVLAYAIPADQETNPQKALIREALQHRPLPTHLRGVAPRLGRFGNGIWAAASGYAEHIAKIANEILATGSNTPTAPPFPGTLRRGASRGEQVCRVQARLRIFGHRVDRVAGCPFGPQTEAGVKAFQSARNIDPADGAVNEKTWNALFT